MRKLYFTFAIVAGMGLIASCGDATEEATSESNKANTEEVAAAESAPAEAVEAKEEESAE